MQCHRPHWNKLWGSEPESYQINKTETENPELKPNLVTNLVKFSSK